MYRSCRAGRNAWRQLVSGACRPQQRAATTSTSTSSSISASTHENATTATTTITTAQEQDEEIPQVIFSGIQPTGIPHLGNYLGALREWKRLQDTAHPTTQLLFFIADLHAITVPRPAEELYEHRLHMMAALRAMGLDENRSTIFFQSAVPHHTDLQWILSCTASMGYLSRMTQWKVSDGSMGGPLQQPLDHSGANPARRARCNSATMRPWTTRR
jgi:tryptophanyl-tRNA synthetase